MRERRKSFQDAKHKLLQSKIGDIEKKKTKRQDPPPNLDVLKDDETVKKPKKIQCRRVTVVLERMNIEKINKLLGTEYLPQPDLSSSQPTRNIVYVSPRKNVTNEEQVQNEDVQQDDFDVPMESIENLLLNLSIDEMAIARQTETDIQTYVHALSSIISDQNIQFNRAARTSIHQLYESIESHMPTEPAVGSKNGFIDSNRISYGPFVKYQNDTFAVNFFFSRQ